MRIVPLIDCPEVIPTLVAWQHAEWSYLNPRRPIEDRTREFEEHLGRGVLPATFVALDDEGRPLGSASFIASDLDERPELSPWLAGVFVAPAFRRRGVGDAVVARIEQAARDLGVPTLYLYTPDRAHFYARRGWQVFEETEHNGTAITIMTLDLTRGEA